MSFWQRWIQSSSLQHFIDKWKTLNIFVRIGSIAFVSISGTKEAFPTFVKRSKKKYSLVDGIVLSLFLYMNSLKN
jgi:hypothetical protein